MTREQWLSNRFWIVGLLFAIALLAVEPMAARTLRGSLDTALAQQQERRAALLQQKERWDQDLAIARAALDNGTKPDVTALLAPSDAAAMGRHLESLAASARLFNVTHALSEPQPWKDNKTGVQGLVLRPLTFEADAPHDLDLFHFFETLDNLEGRLDLTRLDITRLEGAAPLGDEGKENTDAALAALNLHLAASFDWIANAPHQEGGITP